MDGNLNPTGRALSIWGNFLGKQMVRADSTGKVLAYASLDPGSQTLYVYLINKGDHAETVELDIEGNKILAIREAWELFGNTSEDLHPVWQQAGWIKPGKPVTLKGTSITVLVAVLKDKGSKEPGQEINLLDIIGYQAVEK
jgi:hypothetical protein